MGVEHVIVGIQNVDSLRPRSVAIPIHAVNRYLMGVLVSEIQVECKDGGTVPCRGDSVCGCHFLQSADVSGAGYPDALRTIRARTNVAWIHGTLPQNPI